MTAPTSRILFELNISVDNHRRRHLNEKSRYSLNNMRPSRTTGPYLVYRIRPLSFNLSQKTPTICTNPNAKLFVKGSYVKGICTYDDKEHIGTVQRVYRDPDDPSKVSSVYILDMNSMMVPLEPETVKFAQRKSKSPK